MGRCPNNKAGGQKKKYSHKSARRTKFLKKGEDIVFEEVQRYLVQAELAQAQGQQGAHSAHSAAPAAPTVGALESDVAGSLPTRIPLGVEATDLPGMGKWYCMFCDRHFASGTVRELHNKTKLHKKRVKLMREGPRPHSQLDAELAAGMSKPDNGKPLRILKDSAMAT